MAAGQEECRNGRDSLCSREQSLRSTMMTTCNGRKTVVRSRSGRKANLPDGRPALDEIVANGAFIHLEQMSHDHWWMGIEAGGKYLHLNFGVREGRLYVHLSDQGEDDAEWEGDNREQPPP